MSSQSHSYSRLDNRKLAQADAEDARKSALAMAQQLKKCVEDLTEAQKRIAAHDAVPCVCFFLLTFFFDRGGLRGETCVYHTCARNMVD